MSSPVPQLKFLKDMFISHENQMKLTTLVGFYHILLLI